MGGIEGLSQKRIAIFCGHYGSGKTNIAVNYAIYLRRQYERVAIADLDIVNPYFRTEDSRDELSAAEVRLICSPYANSNVDIPALPQEMYAVTDDRALRCVLDIGGDDRGALALGRLSPAVLKENNYEMLAVINRFRPLTRNVEDTREVLDEITMASGIPFTGLVNNSNLGEETTPDVVRSSLDYAYAVSENTGLPIVMTTVKDSLYEALSGEIENLFPMKLQKKPVL